jgi:glycosyltransferase involved in cell wall biosynthesis
VERLTDVPTVTTNHGPFSAVLAPLYRAVATRVPVLAISRHQAATAGDIPIQAVIHHGLDLARFPLGPGGGDYALFLGRMSPDKGIDRAIRVARSAGLPLVIAAKMREPDEHTYFREVVEPMLGPDVEFVGEIGHADKVELLGRATALLNPICWPEPFGMVMIEALACGTPVVVTTCGAAPEIVVDGVTGFVCRDDGELVRGLAAAASVDRAACRRRVETHFSARRMVDAHLRVYGTLRARRAGQRHPALELVSGA